jgi:Zn ribbon nucleic-acid-binding protein
MNQRRACPACDAQDAKLAFVVDGYPHQRCARCRSFVNRIGRSVGLEA